MIVKNVSISGDSLGRLLRKIAEEKRLAAPVRNEELGDVDFAVTESGTDICFDYDNTVSSAKEFFFPNCETMFSFEGGSNESIRSEQEDEAIVLFGVRSCDVRAIQQLDSFYSGDFEDNYYLDKRKKSLLISLACSELWEQCFCTSTGTGPVLEDGFDVQLAGVDGGYAVQVGSEKGLAFIEEYESFFGEVADFDIEDFRAKIKGAEVKFDMERVSRRLKAGEVGDAFWADVADRCQSCGLCLFLCPTCSCFSVTDKSTPGGAKRRIRQWDGCYFKGFTRIAGGNDVVRSREEMVQRKYFHKLVHDVERFGSCGCVGCGRCNLTCVGNVNWLENIIRIDKGA